MQMNADETYFYFIFDVTFQSVTDYNYVWQVTYQDVYLVILNHSSFRFLQIGGLVDNWAELEHIWDHVVSRELNVKWEDHPILLTELASAPKRQRERILEVGSANVVESFIVSWPKMSAKCSFYELSFPFASSFLHIFNHY